MNLDHVCVENPRFVPSPPSSPRALSLVRPGQAYLPRCVQWWIRLCALRFAQKVLDRFIYACQGKWL
jgi:hypothetical protein